MIRQLLASVAGATLPLALVHAPALADLRPNAGMLRWPDVSADTIVFSYANDLWTVPKAGGVASPLAGPSGQESFPRFSADGATIAFVGNYDGNRDLYTIPTAGGIATRVTHHPGAETLADWTPDARLLFMTNAFAGLQRQSQLWHVAPTGGLPEKTPVPYAGFGSISPDGQWLAYTPHSTDTRTWKRYRGGMATDVWLFNLRDKSSKRITEWEGNDTLPMWPPRADSTEAYYLSDAGPEHRLNVWKYALSTGQRTQVTTFADNDVRWPSIGPGNAAAPAGEIVFQLGSKLMLLDLATRQSREVLVTIPGDRPTIRARAVDASKNLTWATLSPSAKRVIAEGRGDVWTLPAKEGITRNLTRSSGVFERMPTMSPDSKWIAYFSDHSGEYQLYLRPSDVRPEDKKNDGKKEVQKDNKQDDAQAQPNASEPDAPEPAPNAEKAPLHPASLAASVEVRTLTASPTGYPLNVNWSPDSAWIALANHKSELTIVNVESGESRVVDRDPWNEEPAWSWSHDSGWLAYSRNDEGNAHAAIWLYEVATGAKTRVTDPMFVASTPTFDRKGELLYFQSNREVSSPVYADNDTTFAYAGTARIYAVPLRADVKNPLAPKADEESIKDDKKDDKKKDEAKKDEAKKDEGKKDETKPDDAKPQPTPEAQPADNKSDPKEGKQEVNKDDKQDDKKKVITIDLDAFERRALELPIGQGLFGPMAVNDSGKLLFVRRGFPRDDDGGAPSRPSIKIFDLASDERKEESVAEGAGFAASADGKKLLVNQQGTWKVFEASSGGGKPTTVPTGDMRVQIDPREEWRQILRETHRVQRDYFYEPTLHAVDWDAQYRHYAAMLEDAVTREDVAWIQAEFISELNIGHAYVSSPGDVEQAPTVGVGLLAADYELATDPTGAGAYRITRIYEGAPWDSDARGPLSQPGVDAKVGDYLLAVNGVPIDATRDPWAAFQGKAGEVVTITLGKNPAIDDQARDVSVRTLSTEVPQRYRAWIERNRAYVDHKTQGQVGYIYVPNTGVDGQNDLFRQFFGQRHKAALIIDERWNGGGQIPTRFIELLNRPVTNYWARRDGKDWTWPPDSHQGHQAMLANGLAGSGGDMFPWLFKFNNLGPVVGTRTWGGLVGISGNPGMIDGGYISVPTFGFYEKDGTWGVEGHGVDPTHEVIDDPALMWDGPGAPDGLRDPQLDKAIDLMLTAIRERPYTPPQRPPSPNRRGFGLDPKDK
jgi:tricorn protease